jgi:hypothetical protein
LYDTVVYNGRMVHRAALVTLGVLLIPGCHLIFPFGVVASDAGADGTDAGADGTLDGGGDLLATDGDGPPADIPIPCTAAAIGKPCTSPADCAGGGGFCLGTTGTKGGVCSCYCTPDDPSTTTKNEDSCPGQPQNVCASYWSTKGLLSSCFRTCTPRLGANDCKDGVACDPGSAYTFAVPAFQALCAYRGCTTDSACPVVTDRTCSGSTPCEKGEQCAKVLYLNEVIETRCIKPGACDLTSGLCDKKPALLSNVGAKVGDPCQSDLDCGEAMSCLLEVDTAKLFKKTGATCTAGAECCSGACSGGTCTQGVCPVRHRNGYCMILGCAFGASLTARACPAGSSCNLGYKRGLCQPTCSLSTASECRGHTADLIGDYECRSWDRVPFKLDSSRKTAKTPVCDFGPAVSCTLFKGSSKDCSALGDTTNSTQMDCRDLANSVLADKVSPVGFCLDKTASGTKARSPLP